jgi:PRC-barrel domain protein
VEYKARPLLLSASSIVGATVESPRGEELGKIEEVVLDRGQGCIAYVVVSDGTGALGDRRIAVPWQMLTLDAEKNRFVLDLEGEALENAPSLREGPGLDELTPEELRGIYVYYGHSPYWRGA